MDNRRSLSMFYQVKAILKGSKPPIWRRCFLPSNITFSQMALILETILEMKHSSDYEFEFYNKKDRIIEMKEDALIPSDFYYTYLHAPDTFVNEWLDKETWFNFRFCNKKIDASEYRVEIEKKIEDIKIKENDIEQTVTYPLIVKQVSQSNNNHWSSLEEKNEVLKEFYFLRESETEYMNISEIKKQIENKKGICYSKTTKNRDIHTKKSPNQNLKDFVNKFVSPDVQEKLKQKYNPQSQRSVVQQKRDPSVEEFLKSYTKEELIDFAHLINYPLQNITKNKMTFELARFLLEPSTFKGLLLTAEEEELDAFEHAMEKGCYEPSPEEYKNLMRLIGLSYIVTYSDNKIVIPKEVKFLYDIIKKNGYREFHKKASWLLTCIKAFECIHVVAPIKILYHMYRRKKHMERGYDDFLFTLEKIPKTVNPCVLLNGKVISKHALQNDTYKRMEEKQQEVEYYIPSEDEIRAYGIDGYPSCEKSYEKLATFYHTKLELDESDCKYFCQQAYLYFSIERSTVQYIDLLTRNGITFDSDDTMKQFMDIIINVVQSTRVFYLKGHKQNEIRIHTPFIPFQNVYSMNRVEMPKPLNTNSPFERVHSNQQAKEVAKKIYPNDLCPCGSGKKYKKCCGKK